MKVVVWVLSICILLSGAWAARYLTSQPSHRIKDIPLAAFTAGKTPQNIVFFGTSLTVGNAWPERLIEGLSECFGHSVALTRIAQTGAGSDWGVGAIDQVIDQQPDIVLLEFVINDADIRDGTSLRNSRENHIEIINRLQTELPESQHIVLTMSPAHGLRGLLRPRLAQYVDMTIDVANDAGVSAIDFYPRWHEIDWKPLLPDGLHPTDDATRSVMDNVLLNHFAEAITHDCAPIVHQATQ